MIFRLKTFLFCGLLLSLTACRETPKRVNDSVVKGSDVSGWKTHKRSSYRVVSELPHDSKAYTQGLTLFNGNWIESTGGYGSSSVRRVEKETGKVLEKIDLAGNIFGEGIAELDGNFYQLTWRSRKGFVYDASSLKTLKNFTYSGEGWGLTTDGQSLIMSDGSDRLRFLDPTTFRLLREVSVRRDGKPISRLNELEFIEGEIFANVWLTEEIVRINPVDGKVLGVIDLAGIYPRAGKPNPEFVLNGIAYDAETQKFYVTGKCWPKIYEIQLVKEQ